MKFVGLNMKQLDPLTIEIKERGRSTRYSLSTVASYRRRKSCHLPLHMVTMATQRVHGSKPC